MVLNKRHIHVFHRLLMFLALFSTPGTPFVTKHPSIVLTTNRRAPLAGRTSISWRGENGGTPPATVRNRHRLAERRAQKQRASESLVAEPVESFRELAASAAARQRQRTRKLSSATAKPNNKTDRFVMKKFHHVEFYCGDATAMAARFVWGLGMSIVAKSDQSTGNTQHASYVVKSNDLCFICTAPYALATAKTGASVDIDGPDSFSSPFPGFDPEAAHLFFRRHGMAGKAIGIEVEDAKHAYEQCMAHGGVGVQPPTRVTDRGGLGEAVISEVKAYGDVVIRFISFGDGRTGGEGISSTFLPNFEDVQQQAERGEDSDFGLQRSDHIVLNVWDLVEAVDHLTGMTGMHEFAEFAAAEVGTVDSGLNSIVLASNSEMVLMPVNEPTFGTAKKSQIQTFLEQNDGAGIQHMALKTNDIFRTVRLMRANSGVGGFEFMESPGSEYYRGMPNRIPSLTEDQLKIIEELGLLADQEDEGVLLQVFTKPVGDRPTFFFEIIQRLGCLSEVSGSTVKDERDRIRVPADTVGAAPVVEMLQRPGCGGFGQGNFKALFESIEKYESTLAVGVEEG